MWLPEYVLRIMERLAEAGFCGWAVGGCVRDTLMGAQPHDYDMAVSSTPEETLAVFSDCRTLTNGLKHGTVTLLLAEGPVELTTCRVDGKYSDSRRPDSVEFSRSILDDLSRRDFTVNAMAYRPGEGITDPFGGRSDISARLIRCVGAPERRFTEDALRIVRALRFASVLGFDIDPATAEALHVLRGRLNDIARERIWAETAKLLCGRSAGAVLAQYPDVVDEFLPGAASSARWAQACAAVDRAPRQAPLRLAVLLGGCGLDGMRAGELARGIKADGRAAALVECLVGQTRLPLPDTRAKARRAIGQLGRERFSALLDMREALGEVDPARALRALAEDIVQSGECVDMQGLAVNGRDMIALGLAGKQVGEALCALLDDVLEGRLANERAALLRRARELFCL